MALGQQITVAHAGTAHAPVGAIFGQAQHQLLSDGWLHHGWVGVHEAHHHAVGGHQFALAIGYGIRVVAQQAQ